MTEGPLVTVVVPTWNRLPLLQEAIASVMAQTYSRWELIVVDDGSTDGTPEQISALGDERIRAVACPHTGNIGRLRNIGAAAGSGELIAFLDSDDVWLPRKLELQIEALTDSHARWCYTRFEMMDSCGKPVPMRAGQFRPISGSIVRDLLTSEASVSISTVLVKRDLFETVGQFSDDPRLILREDLEFHLRLAAKAEVAAVPELLARVREHPSRKTHTVIDPHERTAFVFESFIQRGIAPSLAPLARIIGARHLADAGARQLISGNAIKGGRLFMRALGKGVGTAYCGRAFARAVKNRIRG
jgi:glycosyltransferase involved in cell wall biosynthesis